MKTPLLPLICTTLPLALGLAACAPPDLPAELLQDEDVNAPFPDLVPAGEILDQRPLSPRLSPESDAAQQARAEALTRRAETLRNSHVDQVDAIRTWITE